MIVSLIAVNTNVGAQVSTQQDSNLLNYIWDGMPGNGNNMSKTNFGEGPAPTSLDVAWKFVSPGARVYSAFGGHVFASNGSGTVALDPWTGEVHYIIQGVSGSPIKIDDTYMLVGTRMCRIADGSVVWTDSSWLNTYGRVQTSGIQYDISSKLMYRVGGTVWSFADPTKPPTLVWSHPEYEDGWIGYRNYAVIGDGKLFLKKPGLEIKCINMATGELLWSTPTKGSVEYQGLYYDGKFIAGSLSGDVICLDGETGEYLWDFNPGGYWNFWASWPAAAYGLYFEQNFDGYLYAINVNTGQLAWKYKGPGHFYPGGPTVADGKIYCQVGTANYRDPATGARGWDQFVCLDAHTGAEIFEAEMETGQWLSAYGNMYFQLSQQNQSPSSFHGHSGLNPGEVWCVTSQPTDWNMYGRDPSNSFKGAGPRELALKWETFVGGPVTASPAVVDGVAYVGSYDHNIYAFDAYTGEKKWEFQTGYQVKSSLCVMDGKVYTGIDDGYAYCLDAATGQQIWKQWVTGTTTIMSLNMGPQTRSSPKLYEGRLYMGSIDNKLYVLNSLTGDILNQFDSMGAILCSPAVVNGAVYFMSNTPNGVGTVYALDALTLDVIWKLELPYLRGGSRFGGPLGGDISAAPVYAYGAIYQAWDGGNDQPGMGGLYKIDAFTGEVIWNADTYWTRDTVIGYAPMIYYEGYPYYESTLPEECSVGPDGVKISYANRNLDFDNMQYIKQGVILCNDLFYRVIALNATDGTRLWQNFVGRETFGGAVSEPGQYYSVCEAKVIYDWSATTGKKISYTEPPAQSWSSPSLYDGMLFVGGQDWAVRCYGERVHGTTASASVASNVGSVGSQISANSAVDVGGDSGVLVGDQGLVPETAAGEGLFVVSYGAVAVVAVAVVVAATVYLKKRR